MDEVHKRLYNGVCQLFVPSRLFPSRDFSISTHNLQRDLRTTYPTTETSSSTTVSLLTLYQREHTHAQTLYPPIRAWTVRNGITNPGFIQNQGPFFNLSDSTEKNKVSTILPCSGYRGNNDDCFSDQRPRNFGQQLWNSTGRKRSIMTMMTLTD